MVRRRNNPHALCPSQHLSKNDPTNRFHWILPTCVCCFYSGTEGYKKHYAASCSIMLLQHLALFISPELTDESVCVKITTV